MKRRAFLLLLSLVTLSAHGALWRSYGPPGGNIRILEVAPSNPRVLYAGSAGGIFRSRDGGATWRNVSGPISYPLALAIAPDDEDVLFVAADSSNDSLYKTADGGETWNRIGEGLPYPLDVSSIAVDPRSSSIVYVGSRCQPFFSGSPRPQWHEGAGAFKSTNGGVTFTSISGGLVGFQQCVQALVLDPLKPNTIYVTPIYSDDDYARSDDGGTTWRTVAMILPTSDVIADPRDPNRRYGAAFGALVTSTDAGLTWTTLQPTVLDTGERLSSGSSALAIDPVSGRLFLGGHLGAFRSGDGARTFLTLGGEARDRVAGIVFDQASGALTIGTSTGVYRSAAFPWNDWTVLPVGDTSLEMRQVVASQRQPATVYAATDRRLYVTRDNGRTWTQLGEPLPRPSTGYFGVRGVTVDVAENVYVIVAWGSSDRVLKLPAGTSQWIELSAPISSFQSIYADPGTADVVYFARTGGFLVTRDGGATWNFIMTPESASGWTLRIDPNDGAVFYAITARGLMKSTNGGHTWMTILSAPNTESRLELSRADGKTIYVNAPVSLQERALFRSGDGGATWTQHRLPADDSVHSIVADPRDPDTVYLSMIARVFRSRNGGATWEELGTGWPHLPAALTIDRDATVLHAATFKGMWELSLTPPQRRRAVVSR